VLNVQQLAIETELADLKANAEQQGWTFARTGDAEFTLGVLARDNSWLHLKVFLDGYARIPPAWHWLNPETGALGERAHTPVGGNFFHGNGVICAPWNRLAYKSVDDRGPHPDWAIEGDWKANAYTGAATTLAAMALRIALEAMTKYERRLSQR